MTELIQKAINKIDGEAEKLKDTNATLIASHVIDTYLTTDENAQKVLSDKKTLRGCIEKIMSKAKQQAVDAALKEQKAADAKKIEKLKNQLSSERDKYDALSKTKDKEIKEAKKQAAEQANKRIDELTAKNKAADEKLQQALKSAKAANADEDITAIRFLFTNLQSTANEIKGHLDKVASRDFEQAEKLSAVMIKTLNSIVESL